MKFENHIVKKFLVELDTPVYSQSYTLQRRCAAVLKEKVIAGMDAVLTTNFPGNETVRINRIEIDLGNVGADELEEIFSDRLMQAFSKEIKRIAANRNVVTDKVAEVTSEDLLLIEQFFHFLQKGVLSWGLFNISFQTWEKSILEAIEKQPQYFAAKFGEVLQYSPVVAERLLLQFNSRFIITAVEAALPFLKNKFQPVVQVITANAPAAIKEKIILAAVQKVLAAVFNISFTKTSSAVNEYAAYMAGNVTEKNNNLQKINTVVAELFTYLQNNTAAVTDEFIKTPLAVKQSIKPDADVNKKPVEKSTEELAETDDSIFIQNAGLVLLHPFLNNLFTGTGLMQKESFTDSEGSNKAVHLLQYLVNNETETPEYFLTLNKILCGLPQGEHIDRFIKLDEEERAEAMKLLEAVIEHWDVLKNSSPQALQETFLQRTGKLSFSADENAWVLHVEKKGVDILLEKIPWGYGYIKHPWMEHAVRVDW